MIEIKATQTEPNRLAKAGIARCSVSKRIRCELCGSPCLFFVSFISFEHLAYLLGLPRSCWRTIVKNAARECIVHCGRSVATAPSSSGGGLQAALPHANASSQTIIRDDTTSDKDRSAAGAASALEGRFGPGPDPEHHGRGR